MRIAMVSEHASPLATVGGVSVSSLVSASVSALLSSSVFAGGVGSVLMVFGACATAAGTGVLRVSFHTLPAITPPARRPSATNRPVRLLAAGGGCVPLSEEPVADTVDGYAGAGLNPCCASDGFGAGVGVG